MPGLTLAQLGRMTPREIDYLIAGALWRQERSLDLAMIAAGATNPEASLGRRLGESLVPGYGPNGD